MGALCAVVGLSWAAPAPAEPVPATPIPESPEAGDAPQFIGTPATARPLSPPVPPQHPFMAANGRSNLHGDAYMSDTHSVSGPLGRDMERHSTFFAADCASVTFDRAGRIVTICVGLDGPRLVLLDPDTLALLAQFPLPPRQPGAANPFTDFAGGGYFYLDHQDRAVIPTTNRHIWVVEQTEGPAGPAFALVRDYDVSGTLSVDDKLFSALPDWSGRIWWVSQQGVVGTIEPVSGTVRTRDTGEQITNSFAVDERGGVFIVSDAALYRFDAGPDGTPVEGWREEYENTGVRKPGQVSPGSGTTPTLIGGQHVAITDNGDPMSVVVYKRARSVTGPRRVCSQAVFEPGAGATDNSLIGIGRSLIVENNYGYSGPTATTQGGTTTPGLQRVDIIERGSRCRRVWSSSEIAPSVVPKLSLGNGLIYTYTKPADPNDLWYFTAIDFRSGQTVYKRLAGTGLGFNNHYAPVTLGPDGTAYVGTLGGLVMLRDR